MGTTAKSTQLQIRVSADDKRAIARAARRVGMGMSAYVLHRVLGDDERRADDVMRRIADESTRRYALAELHDLLASLGAGELRRTVAAPPPDSLSPQVANYVAAMVEYACGKNGIEVPAWTHAIKPLSTPMFGSQLQSLRLHLLTHSPPPFRRRNIFVDTSIGGRV